MPLPEKIQTPWVEISALPAPSEEISMVTILLLTITVLALLALLAYLWRRPRFQALRQLRRLHQQGSDNRQQLFGVKKALQQALQVNHLPALDTARQDAWQKFCTELTHACYRPTAPASDDVQRLTRQARHWIKQV